MSDTNLAVNHELRDEKCGPSIFLDVFAALPSNASEDRPKIVDPKLYLEALEDSDAYKQLPVWNAIVTILYHHNPDTLRKFLDGKVESFRATIDGGGGSSLANLLIWRNYNQVLCGVFYEVEKGGVCYWDWELVIKCSINYDGTWKVLWEEHDVVTSVHLINIWIRNTTSLLPTGSEYSLNEPVGPLITGFVLNDLIWSDLSFKLN